MGIYSLHPDYGGLFVAETSTTSPETIWAVRIGATNEFERKNYPIGTQGGGTGICPSQNLVEAYESTGEDSDDAYAGLDPRFYATVLRNGDTWNGRTLEIYAGGADDPARQNASPTGYYLRKFLNKNLNLTNDDKRLRSWIVFRYAEILLNFAEAMNEAYGPDDAHGYGMSARDAVDAVRARSGVGMPRSMSTRAMRPPCARPSNTNAASSWPSKTIATGISGAGTMPGRCSTGPCAA